MKVFFGIAILICFFGQSGFAQNAADHSSEPAAEIARDEFRRGLVAGTEFFGESISAEDLDAMLQRRYPPYADILAMAFLRANFAAEVLRKLQDLAVSLDHQELLAELQEVERNLPALPDMSQSMPRAAISEWARTLVAGLLNLRESWLALSVRYVAVPRPAFGVQIGFLHVIQLTLETMKGVMQEHSTLSDEIKASFSERALRWITRAAMYSVEMPTDPVRSVETALRAAANANNARPALLELGNQIHELLGMDDCQGRAYGGYPARALYQSLPGATL